MWALLICVCVCMLSVRFSAYFSLDMLFLSRLLIFFLNVKYYIYVAFGVSRVLIAAKKNSPRGQ